jgi:hypothetical protein
MVAKLRTDWVLEFSEENPDWALVLLQISERQLRFVVPATYIFGDFGRFSRGDLFVFDPNLAELSPIYRVINDRVHCMRGGNTSVSVRDFIAGLISQKKESVSWKRKDWSALRRLIKSYPKRK